MENSLRLLTLALVLVAVCRRHALSQPESAHSDKPNIVFIFADDQSPKTIGAYGNDEISTPNLDKLAKQGVNFTNAYNMGAWNGAVCLASRAMLNTGLSVWDAHAMDKAFKKGEGIENTWAQLMERQGYATYMTGKWHVAAAADKVFQQSKHVRPGMPGDAWNRKPRVGYNRPLSENDNSWSPIDPKFGGYYAGGKHWSEVLKDDAIEFIEQAEKSDSPFFMYLAFNAPHDPRQAPQEFQDIYEASSLSLPTSWQADYPEKEEIGNGPGLRDAALAPFPRTEYATRVHLKEYYAIISHLDAQIGAIMDSLKASGKLDNTYIIYTADHGLAVGEHGLFGKQNMYEHSVRAPFIIWGPNMKGGHSVSANIYLQDAMATSLDLAGIKKPDHVFFNSIASLAKRKTTESHYESIYGAYVESQRMIKKDGFKLIVYPKANTIKLFDIANDPDELSNLATNDSHSGKIEGLFQSLLELQKEMKDQLDIGQLEDYLPLQNR